MFNGFLAGILGGAISIGGGTVLVPLWFRAGIEKNIALSSTGPLIFFSASVSFFTSALLGKYDSALTVFLYFALSFIGSYIVKSNYYNIVDLVIHLTQKYHYDSLVILLLIFIMAISLIVLLPVQYQKYISDSDAFMLFDTLC
jgi:hypothetical protein